MKRKKTKEYSYKVPLVSPSQPLANKDIIKELEKLSHNYHIKKPKKSKCKHIWRQLLLEYVLTNSNGGGCESFRFYCTKCLEIKRIYD